MKYRYEIPSNTNFRNYTVDDVVDDLDPDGFVADEVTGDGLCDAVLDYADFIYAEQWDEIGTDGAMRLLYWESEEDADNDDGANALGQITKTPIE